MGGSGTREWREPETPELPQRQSDRQRAENNEAAWGRVGVTERPGEAATERTSLNSSGKSSDIEVQHVEVPDLLDGQLIEGTLNERGSRSPQPQEADKSGWASRVTETEVSVGASPPPDTAERAQRLVEARAEVEASYDSASSNSVEHDTKPTEALQVEESAERGVMVEAAELEAGHSKTPQQYELLERNIDAAEVLPLKPGEHSTEAYEVDFHDGQKAVYKPSAGEVPLRDGIERGTCWKNEVAAYHVDNLLGFELVPVTVEVDGPRGVGSLQCWAPEMARAPGDYSSVDVQMVGTLDYILASGDRHAENYLTQTDGRPAAIDNGLSLPGDARNAMKSDFVEAALNRPLDERIVEKLNAVDSNEFRIRLSACGVSDAGIAGALARLDEAQSGFITGRAWPGEIFDSNYNLLKRSDRY